ncbi:hypothetical protein ROJ8625_04127 [Roseivivax jejudonensis]|uniref:DUF4398 domain-containing protein n=1 Tax=Roseivivax jejudonensis TaxID=1529041 RepID=A0A1X7ADL1_9RHOB|nr:hypothetical protein [Roseivivax jejudonensis]SLN74931.1 hypothetical protein ROJ8625_04127 [Roseivivax jejudonensis]
MNDRTDQQRAADATQYLIDSAYKLGAAKGEMIRAEHMVGVARRQVVLHSDAKTIAEKEAEAYASPEYREAVSAYAEAATEYEKLRASRDAAQAQISYWQTVSANQRGAEKGYGSAG